MEQSDGNGESGAERGARDDARPALRPYSPPSFIEEEALDVFMLACARFTKRACGSNVNQS